MDDILQAIIMSDAGFVLLGLVVCSPLLYLVLHDPRDKEKAHSVLGPVEGLLKKESKLPRLAAALGIVVAACSMAFFRFEWLPGHLQYLPFIPLAGIVLGAALGLALSMISSKKAKRPKVLGEFERQWTIDGENVQVSYEWRDFDPDSCWENHPSGTCFRVQVSAHLPFTFTLVLRGGPAHLPGPNAPFESSRELSDRVTLVGCSPHDLPTQVFNDPFLADHILKLFSRTVSRLDISSKYLAAEIDGKQGQRELMTQMARDLITIRKDLGELLAHVG